MATGKGADREWLRAVYKMMADGLTTTQIAELLGMTQPAVSRYAKKKYMETALKMMELADAGQSLEEIGKAFGVSKQRVGQLIGVERKLGSTGKVMSIDADPQVWDIMMAQCDRFDIPVKRTRGIDGRAFTQLMDRIASGEIILVQRQAE